MPGLGNQGDQERELKIKTEKQQQLPNFDARFKEGAKGFICNALMSTKLMHDA